MGKCILICWKCPGGMIPNEEIDPDLQECLVRDTLKRKKASSNQSCQHKQKESAALFFVCLLPISLKNIGCDNMRGSMVSCSLCSRKSHMFAVRSEKYTCLQIAAENQAMRVCSGKPCRSMMEERKTWIRRLPDNK